MASTMESTMHSMPGSYLFQYDNTYYGSKSQYVFQPPAPSPTLSRRTSQIPRPTSQTPSNSYSNRKRPRLDAKTSYFSRPARPSNSNPNGSIASTPLTLDGSYDHVTCSTNLESSAYSFDGHSLASPSPLANSHYQLAGGLDTPSASLEHSLDEWAQNEAEKDYRFNRYTSTANTSRTTISAVGGSVRIGSQSQSSNFGAASSNSHGRKRTRSPAKASISLTGWGIRSTAWALTGGLAGRVFNFCVNTAFRGFGAGGGDAYQLKDASPSAIPDFSFANGYDQQASHSNAYSHDFGGFVEDYMNSPESRRRPPDYDYHSTPLALKNDWQLVESMVPTDSGDEQSPARKRSRASVAGSWQRPALSRTSTAGRKSTASGASYASPRSRTSIGTASHQPQGNASSGNPPFPALRRAQSSQSHSRSHSHSCLSADTTFVLNQPASSGSGQGSPSRPSSAASTRQQPSNSNLSPEVQNYKRKLKAREKAQDDNFSRLNAQLRDMIREGREALGSKVEVFDEVGLMASDGDVDEGFYEDGWNQ